MWEKIENEEDRDWIEYHKGIGYFAILKIWLSSDGVFKASLTDKDGSRSVTSLEAPSITLAMLEAEKWVETET